MFNKIIYTAIIFCAALLISQDSNAQSASSPSEIILNPAPAQSTAPNQDMDKVPVQKEASYVTGENGEKIYFATEPVTSPAQGTTTVPKPAIKTIPAPEKVKVSNSK